MAPPLFALSPSWDDVGTSGPCAVFLRRLPPRRLRLLRPRHCSYRVAAPFLTLPSMEKHAVITTHLQHAYITFTVRISHACFADAAVICVTAPNTLAGLPLGNHLRAPPHAAYWRYFHFATAFSTRCRRCSAPGLYALPRSTRCAHTPPLANLPCRFRAEPASLLPSNATIGNAGPAFDAIVRQHAAHRHSSCRSCSTKCARLRIQLELTCIWAT